MEKQIDFRSFDGTPLQGTCSGHPMSKESIVLMVHGITSNREELGLFSDFATFLAEKKIPSFRFDYRGHGASRLPMEALTLSGIVNDIEAAGNCAMEYFDSHTINIVGMSFGGGVSAYWAARTKLPVSSVSMWAPVIDYCEDVLGQHGLVSNGKLDEQSQKTLQNQGYLVIDDIRYGSALLNELEFISGIEGISQLKYNSLIVHGDADSIVPYSSSEKFVRLNPKCKLVNIHGTDHGFGVEGDDDLDTPETKARHLDVYKIVCQFFDASN